jgi:hypothetical protein
MLNNELVQRSDFQKLLPSKSPFLPDGLECPPPLRQAMTITTRQPLHLIISPHFF